ncbi:transporter [Cupriavidus necator]
MCSRKRRHAAALKSHLGATLAVRLLCGTLMACGVATATHAATVPDAGGFVPLPAGTNLLLGYAQHTRGSTFYDGAGPIGADVGLRLNAGALRYVRYEQFGDHPVDFEAVLPYGQQRLESPGTVNTGLGDAILGAAAWAIADDERGEYLAGAAYLTVPSGAEKNQGIALSGNRWATDLQLAYTRKLYGSLFLDLLGQVELYGDDRSTGARRDPFWRGFAHLRYVYSAGSHIAMTLRHGGGAKETLDGATVVPSRKETTAALTWAFMVTDTAQLQLQYVRDLRVRNTIK